jgi:hypothetical protein
VQNSKSSGGCFFGKSKSKIKLFLSAVQVLYRLMGNFSIHDISPIIVNLVEDSDSDLENSDDDEDK